MENTIHDSDPARLLRYRDSIYASDLLVCTIAYFDFFTRLYDTPKLFYEICRELKIQARPAEVMVNSLHIS